MVAYAQGMAGNTDMNKKIINELLIRESQYFVSPTMIAIAYMGQANYENALVWSEKALEVNDAFHVWLLLTLFEPIHGNQRFIEIIKKSKLEEALYKLYPVLSTAD